MQPDFLRVKGRWCSWEPDRPAGAGVRPIGRYPCPLGPDRTHSTEASMTASPRVGIALCVTMALLPACSERSAPDDSAAVRDPIDTAGLAVTGIDTTTVPGATAPTLPQPASTDSGAIPHQPPGASVGSTRTPTVPNDSGAIPHRPSAASAGSIRVPTVPNDSGAIPRNAPQRARLTPRTMSRP
jgi:hypothetical protein